MKVSNGRESYRLLWLTYRQQLMNYQKWEEACVRLGFARIPKDDTEKSEKGHIVFLEGQENRYLQFDEMALFLDGATPTADRKGTTPTFGEIPDAGNAASKSSKKVTLLLGIAGDELLPPFIIVSSSAKEGNRKLDAKMFPAFRQVVGAYGFQCEYYYDNVFAATASGYVILICMLLLVLFDIIQSLTHVLRSFFLLSSSPTAEPTMKYSELGF